MKTQVLPRIAARIVSLLLILAACGATPAQQPTTATGEFLSAPSDADPLEICRQHLQRNKAAKGLSADDLAELVVRDRYQTRRTRTTHLYLRQQIDGIDVEGADFVAAIDSRGRLLTEGDRLVRGLRPRISTRTPSLSARQAIRHAARQLGLEESVPLRRTTAPSGPARATVFRSSTISRDEIPAKLSYLETDQGAVRLTWNLVIRTPDGRDWWNLFVDAESGEILQRVNWIAQDSYNVFPAPLESPDEGLRALVADAADPTASPFGWHDTDGADGAEFTDTRGNNVFAQEDVNANNSGGLRPNGGAGLNFDSSFDPALAPSANQGAGVTNVFYWNNILHDVLYQHGFDEPAGNFQSNNYGNGGAQGDPVQADTQDGSNTNNARFATPPDGQDPRMEMFLFTNEAVLEVLSPPSIVGGYAAIGADFGDLTGAVTAALVQAIDPADAAGPTTTDACSPLTNAAAVNGNIALVDRGVCLFVEKAATAQAAGAVGVIVVNNDGDALVHMSGDDPSVVIAAIFIAESDGDALKAELDDAVTVTIETGGLRDSAFDNGLIAHEYGHGLSNRLTGGPSNVNCLFTTQSAGMGEGWSDWLALTMVGKAGDTAIDAMPLGTYVKGQPSSSPGIRNHPYSRDLGQSPLTFQDIQTLNRPHGIGEVWASALWDLYWNLIDAYGYDPDLYAGTGGNNLLMQLVLDGLKLQPCTPTFLEARDALLSADGNATAGANQCLIWEAFARRGIGFSATSPSNSNSVAVNEAFDEPAVCVAECGNGTLEAGEQCDDDNNVFFDGCASNCRLESALPPLVGTAAGGSIRLTIDGVAVVVPTSPGQSVADVASAVADAVNLSTALQALYGAAAAQNGDVVVSGAVDAFSVDDDGLVQTVPPRQIPALPWVWIVVGAGLLTGVAVSGLSKKRRSRSR